MKTFAKGLPGRIALCLVAALALTVASRPHVLLVWPLLYGLARAGAAVASAVEDAATDQMRSASP